MSRGGDEFLLLMHAMRIYEWYADDTNSVKKSLSMDWSNPKPFYGAAVKTCAVTFMNLKFIARESFGFATHEFVASDFGNNWSQAN
jgi:hypothetical protein